MRGKTGADREISVNTYTGGFTTMLNHHLRNRNLSLKAVGLLSKMLSLPPDWDYSIRGLAMLNTDGIDGIRTAMKELEDEGYVVRVQSRDERGRMSRNKYTVYALPQKEKPSPDLPSSENPTTVKPPPDEPMTEKPTQINTNQVIPKKRNDSLSKYQSINPDGMDAMDERERYEEIIRENLEVDILSQDSRYDIDRVNEIIEVMLDAICSTSPTLRVNNADMPKEVVKSRLLKLNSSHIDYVFDAMRKSPSDIRNIRAYMLTALYNAPATIDNYYSALVNHDFYGQDRLAGSKKPKTYDYSLAGLSNDAKVLYALMLDRASISKVNGFLETDGTIRIYFTVEQAQKKLHRSRQCATRIFHELEFSGLICRKKQGLGKPALITLNYPSNAKLIQPKKGSSILSG